MERTEIETYARIQLPPTALEIQTYSEAGLDRLILVRFRLPPSDLATFLLNADYMMPLRDGYDPTTKTGYTNIEWWKPGSLNLFAGTEQMQAGFVKRLVVDKSDASSYVVYLEHFEI